MDDEGTEIDEHTATCLFLFQEEADLPIFHELLFQQKKNHHREGGDAGELHDN